VEEVGEGVSRVKKGDRVVVQPTIYDGTCGACEAGLFNCCYSNGFVGLSGFGGGLAEHIVLNESFVFRLPDNIPLDIGALVEPLAVAWHAVKMGDVSPDESVLVLGAGPIGLAVILSLKARGVDKIIVSEVAERRKQFAKELGAKHILDPTKDDIPARCRELCEGQGVHKVFDAAGVQAGLDSAIDAVRARGKYFAAEACVMSSYPLYMRLLSSRCINAAVQDSSPIANQLVLKFGETMC
jgi:threonine dehydrogenase-like Zn-dependent dehydrogenase